MNFQTFNFHPQITAGIQALGYTIPTPIQEKAIPAVLTGRDVMGLAQTGTGKTAAFVLPILQRLMDAPPAVGANKRVRVLIVAPTRELAEQINEAFGALAQKTPFRSMTIYGGVNINPQLKQLRMGVDVVVACPGRLLDHIQRNSISLSGLEVLVLDEADHMFDMGFLPTIRQILKHVPKKRQNLLFSATMPTDIRKLAQDILVNPITIEINNSAPATTVAHALYPVEQNLKTALLLEILKRTDTESILIFTRTKHRAKSVDQVLQKEGFRATSLQGNLSQNRRQEALDGFRDGKYQIMVATDIAARGIDVSLISHVINFDVPATAESYTHRIGRTGRAAKTGDAFTFVAREDIPIIKQIERTLRTEIERRTLPDFDYKQAGRKNEFVRAARGGGQFHRANNSRPASGGGRPPQGGGNQGRPGHHGNRRPSHSVFSS